MSERGAGAVHYLPDSERLAREIAREAGLPALPIALHRFPDNEALVRVETPCPTWAVLVAQLHDPDAKLFPLLLAIDALRRAGVERLTLLAPYLPYMRQDVAFHPGEAISQQLIARLLGEAADELLTLEPHLHRIDRLDAVFACDARALDAAPLLAGWCKRDSDRPLLVGPDAESEAWTRSLAERADLPWIVCSKQRLGDDLVRITLPDASLEGVTRAILVDDIASSGTTLAAAADALHARGVETVDAAVVHAIFAAGAVERIATARIRRLVSCDTIPHESNAIETARFFADAIHATRPEPRNRRAAACSD